MGREGVGVRGVWREVVVSLVSLVEEWLELLLMVVEDMVRDSAAVVAVI